jgi:hypothetical protein
MINEKELDIIIKSFNFYRTGHDVNIYYIDYDMDKIKQELTEKGILEKSALEEARKYVENWINRDRREYISWKTEIKKMQELYEKAISELQGEKK